jgi:hypothetical protein
MTRGDRADDRSDLVRNSADDPPSSDAGSDGSPPSTDPRRIESLAVTESDVIDSLEAAARGDREIVLRVTPPFSGRMRARLHDAGAVGTSDSPGAAGDESDGADAAPIHIPPGRLVADPPTYPTVDDTEDDLRASGTPYSRERHRERHKAAVEAWRTAVRERLVEAVTLHTAAGRTTVSVAYLG